MSNVSLQTSKNGTNSPLFEPYRLGNYNLQTRIVYAPLTRCRGLDMIAQPAAVEYYSQRAHEGLMLTEGTIVSQQGTGYPNVPGIWSEQQVEAWKPVVKAVKNKGKGTTFFMQLWHVGRSSHPEYQPNNDLPVGPSAVAIGERGGQVFVPSQGKSVPFPVPRALEVEEIPGIVDQFVNAARNAIKAGFDGVEVHSANGYLLDAFLKQSSNKRSDEYGGSIENRSRLTLQVVEAVAKEIGPGKVGIRFSPYSKDFNDCREPDTKSTIDLHVYLSEQLSKLDIAYIHFVTARAQGSNDADKDTLDLESENLKPFRKAFKNTIIAAGGYLKDTAEGEVEQGTADLICFGRWFLANPDFPDRLRDNKPFNKYNRDTFYTPDQVEGYTDYPLFKDIPKDTPTEKHYSGATVFAAPKQKTANEHEP